MVHDLYLEFLEFIKSKEPTIKFIMEVEPDNKIPVLDVRIKKNEDHTLSARAYQKPIHTGRDLN